MKGGGYILRLLAVAGAFFAAANVGMAIPVGPAHVSPAWPPAGLAFVVLVMAGRRYAPGVWLGSFLMARYSNLSLPVSMSLATGGALAALAGTVLFRHLESDRRLERVRDVLALLGSAGLSAAVAATIGIVTLCFGHRMPWSLAMSQAGVWWVGDTMGIMMIAPVAFTLRPGALVPLRRVPEALSLIVLLVGTSAIVFGTRVSPGGAIQSQAFLVFPCVMWAALRFGPRGAALAAATISALALAATSLARGPFALAIPVSGVLMLQLFMSTVYLTALLLAAATAERVKAAAQVALLAEAVRESSEERNRIRAKLALAERMATVGTLAAGVGHEINTPLGFIIANLEGLLRRLAAFASGEGDAVHQSVRDALEGAERIRVIVRDLQTLSRDTEDERTLVDLERVTKAALNMAAHEIGRRATVVRELGEAPRVHANEGRLGQVLLNLLVNAAQSMTAAREDHVLTVRTGTAADGRAFFEVQDTGVGIPADVLPRVFEPFFTTKGPGGGTGLGLSICHQIVSACGGEIVVESTVGKGTLVRVLLPASAPHLGEAASPSPPAVSVVAPASEGARRGRVLVIDDEIRFARSLRWLLEPEYEVFVTSSGGEALDWIARGDAFDAILCDLQMPNMSGMDIHARLSAAAPAVAEKLIFVSGGAITDEAQEFVRAVKNKVLDKPVKPEVLRAALAGAMSAGMGRDHAAE